MQRRGNTTRLRTRFGVAGLLVLILYTLLASVGPVPSAQAADPVFKGTIRTGPKDPLEGVKITAVDSSGSEVGSTTSGADGKWEIPFSDIGVYTVSIDLATVPEGVELLDATKHSVELEVDQLRNKGVAFKFIESGGPTTTIAIDPLWKRLFDRATIGVRLGLLIALAAIGLSLIYGVTGLVNFAHSEMVTFGAVFAFMLEASSNGMPFPIVVLLTAVAGGILGFGLEKGLFQPLRRRKMNDISLMIVSIGLAFVMRYTLLMVFGSEPTHYKAYRGQEILHIGPFSLVPKNYVVMIISLVMLLLVGMLLQRTKLGTAMRAVSDNPALSRSSGINVDTTILAVWITGSALAAVGGTFLGITQVVEWQMGEKMLLLIFAAVTLGGLGTAYGAIVGGLAIGVASEMSTFWLDNELKYLVALTVLIFILLFRPQGILGVRERFG